MTALWTLFFAGRGHAIFALGSAELRPRCRERPGVLVVPAMSAAFCSCIQAKWLLLPACSALLLFLLCSSAANGVVKPGAVRMPGTAEAKAFHIKPQAPKPAYLAVSKVAGLPAEGSSPSDHSLSTCRLHGKPEAVWPQCMLPALAGCMTCCAHPCSCILCGSLLQVQALQSVLSHQPECAGRMHDLLSPLQVGTAAPQAPAAPQTAAAGASDKPPSLMIFVTKMFEKIGREPEHVKQRAQVDLLILQSQLAAPTGLPMWHQLRVLSFWNTCLMF